ncbi:AAA family ATPase, partial [Deinococcus sp. 6YEL10]|uniref:ATP-binding protein n=1 Tax=Deinococcus sp. 6YEL10 TaxID=2745870 RepID=UPI001E34EF80
GTLHLQADDLLGRLTTHARSFLPGLHAFQAQRQTVLTRERARLRLAEFQPRPLTSFVRNRLITDVYLPLIGDNLAKQIGAAGDGKRSDLMGLLLLISPPGYGKTTLMEYVAHRLGLVFVRVNGPSLGHAVRSLDPAQAPDAASRQELEKLNLALEMGGNVMLYVDDIQHTHPEFLQKFIALTDGTRRIEGVWNGEARTYDLRGRRFAVVMAGNPYTETGEVFRIPDMLANRADVYNLGDVLGGMEDTFLLSYVENSLTSNAVLAPLAGRELSDIPKLVARAQGHEDPGELSHPYSEAELTEILATLRLLLRARDTLARVNAAYIASAAQSDRDRTEPPFKLQGSYRNMNKICEKLSPVMNDAELDGVISDHYRSEAQLLTTGAEENLLKLAELRGTLTPEQAARWAQIRENYARERRMGAADGDTGARMVAQLA